MVIFPRRWRPNRLTLAGMVVLGAVVAGGCSPAQSPRPNGTASTSAPAVATVSIAAPSAAPAPLPPAAKSTPTPPAFPAVVALSWLNGVAPEPAIRLPADGFVRWKGSAPGEQAELLPDGAYRWVGPDGSMVGCVAPLSAGRRHLRCVGMDAAGDTAVTADADGPRTVYGPGGRLLGRFTISGARVGGARSSEPMNQAIDATGVDMASLVDFATRQQPFSGGIVGDPHLITGRGIRVSTQRAGDFQARAGDPAHQIQIRTEAMPYQSDVSYVSAAAVGVPGHRIELALPGKLSIDGSPMASSTTFRQMLLPAGPAVGLWPPDADGVVDVVVLWTDGSSVSMAADSSLGMTVVANLARSPASGLFGAVTTAPDTGTGTTSVGASPDSPDAVPTAPRSDFLARAASSGAVSVDQVVDSWRVPAGESLLAGDAPALQPSTVPPVISHAAISQAQTACAAQHGADPNDVAACVFDVARTGDDGYVARDGQLALASTPSKVPGSLAAGWPALALPATPSSQVIELGRPFETTIAAGSRRTYQVSVPVAESLTIAAGQCRKGEAGKPERGAAALRLFDVAGNAVSARESNCGTGGTDRLSAGTYYLALAGPIVGPAASFKVRVSGSPPASPPGG